MIDYATRIALTAPRRLTAAERRRYVPPECAPEDRERVWQQWLVFMSRPPMGQPRLPHSLAAPRGLQRRHSKAARAARRELAWRCYQLRTERGLSTRAIAAEVGLAQRTVAGWLLGIEPIPGREKPVRRPELPQVSGPK